MTQTNTTSSGQILRTWKAPIHPTYERTHRWYMTAGILVIVAAAYGILTGAWTFSVVAVLSGAMYFLIRDHQHPAETIVLTEFGVALKNSFMRWEDLRGFWILYTADYTQLRFTPKDEHKPELKIQIGDQNVLELKDVLSNFLPELPEMQEGIVDFIIRFCKL